MSCRGTQKCYLYTGIEGSIMLPSGTQRFLEYQEGDGCGGTPEPCDVWRCRRGDSFCHPDSFNNQTGVFTSPSDSFYDIYLVVNYFGLSVPLDMSGVTTTSICRKLKQNICGVELPDDSIFDIALLASTNPISRLGSNKLASSTISFCVPLNRGDQLKFLVYQENNLDLDLQIFAELMIKRGRNIDKRINECQGPFCADQPKDRTHELLHKYKIHM